MNFFDNFSFRVKLSVAPALCLLLLGVMMIAALWGTSRIRSALDAISGRQLPRYTFAITLATGVREMHGLMNRSIASEAVGATPKEIAVIDAELTAIAPKIEALISKEIAGNDDSIDRRSLQAIQTSYVKYQTAMKDTLDMKSTGLAMAATFLLTAEASYSTLIKQSTQFANDNLQRTSDEAAQAGNVARNITTIVLALGLGALITGLSVSLAFASRLSHRVSMLLGATDALAQGNLAKPIAAAGGDELARAKRSNRASSTHAGSFNRFRAACG